MLLADAVGHSRDGNLVVVGLRGTDEGEAWSLLLQRAFDSDDPDVSLDLDTYSITINEGVTVYSGVQAWGMSDRSLRISLTQAAADVLGVHNDIQILVPDTGFEYEDVKGWFESVLGPPT